MEQHVNALEQHMIDEFRVLKRLIEVTDEERQALVDPLVNDLMALVEEKEATLDKLVQLEDALRMEMNQLAHLFGLKSTEMTVTDLLPLLDTEAAWRIDQLQAGILAMLNELKTQNSANISLANINLERSNTLQTYLFDLLNNGIESFFPAFNFDAEIMGWELDQQV